MATVETANPAREVLNQPPPLAVADAFCAGRLGEARGRVYGTLPAGVDADAGLGRALGI